MTEAFKRVYIKKGKSMSKYKYWSTEKLLRLLNEINWRIDHTSYGMSDINFRNAVESILYNRGIR